MDNAAFLRIKFTPLLKKVSSSDNIVSKCCVEIVPELSDMKNLDKIDWKIDKDLVEYNIPMTYKIIIKNPNPYSPEFPKKVYHSCVDLLPAYSTSNTNFASGDVKSIKSDDLFILSSNSCGEKYDVIPTKALLSNNERNRNKHKTTSMPSRQVFKIDDTSSYHQLGVDKSLEANFSNIPDVQVSRSEETLKADVYKNDNTTTTSDLHNQSANLAKKSSTDSLNAYIESFNEKYTQRKLSLSPICSVNTWDTFPAGPIYITKNTSSYTFSNGIVRNKCKITGMGYSRTRRNDENKEEDNKNTPYSPSGHRLHIYETKTNVKIQVIDDKNRTDNGKMQKSDVNEALRYASYKDITTSISRITITGYDIEKSQNSLFQIKNVYKSLDLSKSRKLVNNINFDPFNLMLNKNNNTFTNNYNIKTVKKTDPEKRLCQIRAPPAIRVARFVKCIEEEIYPLKQMLHEIRSKCAGLGLDLFCGDLVPPTQESIIYKPVSNYEYIVDGTNSQESNSSKPNRVVYTILFNG